MQLQISLLAKAVQGIRTNWRDYLVRVKRVIKK